MSSSDEELKGSTGEIEKPQGRRIKTDMSHIELAFHQMRKWFPKDPFFGVKIDGCKSKEFIMVKDKKNKEKKTDKERKELPRGSGPCRVIYPQRGQIEGNLVDGKFEGFGKLTKANRESYTGMFSNNFGLGYGRYKHTDGTYQWGRFLDDKVVGLVREKSLDGCEYIGNVKGGRKHGVGIVILSAGDTYFGDWKKGEATGFGFYLDKDGRLYEGHLKKGIPNGYGRYRFHNGEEFIGNIKNSVLEGKGIWIYQDGSMFEGIFKNNSMEGDGIIHQNNGSYGVCCTEGEIKWKASHRLLLVKRPVVVYPMRPKYLKSVDTKDISKSCRKILERTSQYKNLKVVTDAARDYSWNFRVPD